MLYYFSFSVLDAYLQSMCMHSQMYQQVAFTII